MLRLINNMTIFISYNINIIHKWFQPKTCLLGSPSIIIVLGLPARYLKPVFKSSISWMKKITFNHTVSYVFLSDRFRRLFWYLIYCMSIQNSWDREYGRFTIFEITNRRWWTERTIFIFSIGREFSFWKWFIHITLYSSLCQM